MRFHVVGADKETGNDIEIDVTATDRAEAEGLATRRGVLVAAVEPIKDADPEEIALVDMDGPGDAGGTVSGATVAAAAAKGGSIAGKPAGASMAGASAIAMASPGASQAGASHVTDPQGSISGAIGASTAQPGAHMEYHIIMNQSLYLLEVAVNKHLKDGWEPQGGLTVGISNNAMQYFQAMIRHRD